MSINFKDLNKSKPYKLFNEYYEKAMSAEQKFIEAVSISSYNKSQREVNSRYVNLKYIINDNWIFFSNYNSPKSEEFNNHNQISALFFWDTLNMQIRIKANIKKSSKTFSDEHFEKRSFEKNALAISSNQSQKVDSYKTVKKNFDKVYQDKDNLKKRPSYWGGFEFIPYYIEFWEGHNSRLNYRKVYELKQNKWIESILQP